MSASHKTARLPFVPLAHWFLAAMAAGCLPIPAQPTVDLSPGAVETTQRASVAPPNQTSTPTSQPSGPAPPCFQILQNGSVHPDPAYPYVGHKYYYEFNPGDNDMPWLRQFAQDKGMLADLDMSGDWKDREFELMKAIIWFTAHSMSWTDVSTFPDTSRRAKDILVLNEVHPDAQWGCGHIAYAAIGLAQAFGIPARAMSTRSPDLPPYGDYLLEMYSTRYNRWILFFKNYGWIEHETDGPLGMRELRAYDQADPIQVQWESDHWEAVPHPPLVFQPSPAQFAPIAPFYSEHWNVRMYQYCAYTARTNPNGNYPECCSPGASTQYLVNDDLVNQQNDFMGYGYTLPVVPIDALDANYPLNNVEARVTMTTDGFLVRLVNNMFEFQRYEIRTDDGPWRPMLLIGTPSQPFTYLWQPAAAPSILSIRGVNKAGVHSPDVVILANTVPSAASPTLNGTGGCIAVAPLK